MRTGSSEAADAYRTTELRLRLMLLGDGSDTAPLVKGEIPRQRVTNELRHLREAFEALLESERSVRREVEDTAEAIERELRRAASARARTTLPETVPAFVTPTQAAETLRTSTSAIYRAIKRGDMQATQISGARGRILIPFAEVERRLESTP